MNGNNFKKKPDTTIEDVDLGGRVAPNSVELEKNIIGSILMNPDLLDISLQRLYHHHFYNNSYGLIYKTMTQMREAKIFVDLVTLTEEMHKKGLLDGIGGAYTIADCAGYFTSPDAFDYSITSVIGYYIKRSAIVLSHEIQELAFDPIIESGELVDIAERKIIDISTSLYTPKYVSIGEQFKVTMDYIDKRASDPKDIIGVPSGFTELDMLTQGFQKSELIIIAGRPSHGKTALALNIARNAAIDYGKSIGINSIEMSNRELAIRFLATEAQVNLSKLKSGRLSDQDWKNINKVANDILKAQIVIDDSSPLTLLEFRSKARRWKIEHDIDMIMVDYLQLMEISGGARMDRHLEIAAITRGLKQLSKELDIPVIALSQLSRKVEDRGGKEKRPQLSDLRESGAIEQDADVVIFINRPEIYISKDDPKFHEVQGLAEIIVGKQRNGPIGDAKLTFLGQYAKFVNRAKDEYEPAFPDNSNHPKDEDAPKYYNNDSPF